MDLKIGIFDTHSFHAKLNEHEIKSKSDAIDATFHSSLDLCGQELY